MWVQWMNACMYACKTLGKDRIDFYFFSVPPLKVSENLCIKKAKSSLFPCCVLHQQTAWQGTVVESEIWIQTHLVLRAAWPLITRLWETAFTFLSFIFPICRLGVWKRAPSLELENPCKTPSTMFGLWENSPYIELLLHIIVISSTALQNIFRHGGIGRGF